MTPKREWPLSWHDVWKVDAETILRNQYRLKGWQPGTVPHQWALAAHRGRWSLYLWKFRRWMQEALG